MTVVNFTDATNAVGPHQVVALSRGGKDGVEKRPDLFDPLPPRRHGQRRLQVQPRQHEAPSCTRRRSAVAEEYVGHVMVFRTFDHISYGLVMDGIRPNAPGRHAARAGVSPAAKETRDGAVIRAVLLWTGVPPHGGHCVTAAMDDRTDADTRAWLILLRAPGWARRPAQPGAARGFRGSGTGGCGATARRIPLRPDTPAWLRQPEGARIDADLAWLDSPGHHLPRLRRPGLPGHAAGNRRCPGGAVRRRRPGLLWRPQVAVVAPAARVPPAWPMPAVSSAPWRRRASWSPAAWPTASTARRMRRRWTPAARPSRSWAPDRTWSIRANTARSPRSPRRRPGQQFPPGTTARTDHFPHATASFRACRSARWWWKRA